MENGKVLRRNKRFIKKVHCVVVENGNSKIEDEDMKFNEDESTIGYGSEEEINSDSESTITEVNDIEEVCSEVPSSTYGRTIKVKTPIDYEDL